MTVPRELWYLPRPRKTNKYRGGFPLHFERKLFELYPSEKILQPFGGRAEYGLRVDMYPTIQGEDIRPDVIGDAHYLPFGDSIFDFTLCDPPYSNDESRKLFNTGKIRTRVYVDEAVRVTKTGGYIGLYHRKMPARPKGTIYDRIICILTRVNHSPRICCVFKKV